MRSRFRSASARGFRGAGLERFVVISKFLQPETVSDYLLLPETFSVLFGTVSARQWVVQAHTLGRAKIEGEHHGNYSGKRIWSDLNDR
jgi:hypothetical protein